MATSTAGILSHAVSKHQSHSIALIAALCMAGFFVTSAVILAPTVLQAKL